MVIVNPPPGVSSATDNNITTLLLTIHILQESQELIGSLRHMLRGMNKFAGDEA